MIKLFNKKNPQQGGQPPSYNNSQREAVTSQSGGGFHTQRSTEAELGKAAGGLHNAKLSKEQRNSRELAAETRTDVTKAREPMRVTGNTMTSPEEQKSPQQSIDHQGASFDDAEQARLSKLLNFNENNRMTRNLSISRSGRHKMKKQQRLSVVEGEMFNSPDKNCGSDVGPTSLSISGPATMV